MLGPVTRFMNVGDKVEYEIAQKQICAFRTSAGSAFPGPGDIKVTSTSDVCYLLVIYLQNTGKSGILTMLPGSRATKPYNSHRSRLHNSVR